MLHGNPLADISNLAAHFTLERQSSSECDAACKSSGRWTKQEHERFVEGLRLYGKDWKRVEIHVGTRTGAQIRSHAQKYFNRLQKALSVHEEEKCFSDVAKTTSSESTATSVDDQSSHPIFNVIREDKASEQGKSTALSREMSALSDYLCSTADSSEISTPNSANSGRRILGEIDSHHVNNQIFSVLAEKSQNGTEKKIANSSHHTGKENSQPEEHVPTLVKTRSEGIKKSKKKRKQVLSAKVMSNSKANTKPGLVDNSPNMSTGSESLQSLPSSLPSASSSLSLMGIPSLLATFQDMMFKKFSEEFNRLLQVRSFTLEKIQHKMIAELAGSEEIQSDIKELTSFCKSMLDLYSRAKMILFHTKGLQLIEQIVSVLKHSSELIRFLHELLGFVNSTTTLTEEDVQELIDQIACNVTDKGVNFINFNLLMRLGYKSKEDIFRNLNKLSDWVELGDNQINQTNSCDHFIREVEMKESSSGIFKVIATKSGTANTSTGNDLIRKRYNCESIACDDETTELLFSGPSLKRSKVDQ
eukprot:CAMPEP_0114993088 /NCGR_PEP_ID=MMETSP0216-20121206/12325_1 /TAXON_ID=223996 /ORGANISM="Protocruzia adherens, Strain Boccale" /LENGTH=530 /DNA_ID=CAMNT_0002356671 /DNA_START=156 /DNA_END=1748 /DNA_ORIENTATION=+